MNQPKDELSKDDINVRIFKVFANTQIEMKTKSNTSPELSANIFSLLFFHWMSPIINLAWRQKRIHFDDIYPCYTADRSEFLENALVNSWNAEMQRSDNSPSLWRALSSAFFLKFYLVGFLKLIYDALQFVGPLMLERLINYYDNDEPSENGYYYVCIILGGSLIQSFILHQYFHVCFRTGMRIRGGLSNFVYRKALLLTPAARQERATGEIVNLMSVDSNRLREITSYAHVLWSGPFQISIAVYLLWVQMGPSVFAGICVMVLLIPLSAWIATKLRKLNKLAMTERDARIKATSELLSGINSIKMYGWEVSFDNLITGIRAKELALLLKVLLLGVISSMAWLITPTLVGLSTFAVYTYGLDNALTASKAFTSLSLFNLLQFPLSMFPRVIGNFVDASVSVNRIRSFLLASELSSSYKNANISPSNHPKIEHVAEIEIQNYDEPSKCVNSIVITSAFFFWDEEKTKPALTDVSLSVMQNELFVIIGPTGSGKSALLSALVGELEPVGNDSLVELQGSIAYCSQVPWIQNATLRQNVLFGSDYDPVWYRKVLFACALAPDLKQLPFGDHTLIGEKGVTLSGGQCARVALARAIYQNSDIVLLDDVFSAVDMHVGRHIFKHCIQDILGKKCVVLVSHARWLLPFADRIVLISDGAITNIGEFSEIAGLLKTDDDPESHEIKDSEQKENEDENIDEIEFNRRMRIDFELDMNAMEQRNEELVTAEMREEGNVKLDVYKSYIRAIGGYSFFFAVLLFGFGISTTSSVGASRWLAYWATHISDHSTSYYLLIYAALSVGSIVWSSLFLLAFALGSLRASTHYHSKLLRALLRAPISFFEITPTGRILNRFSGDINAIDQKLNSAIMMYIRMMFTLAATISVISYVTPYFLIAFVPLFFVYYRFSLIYINASREFKRWDSVLQSPIFSHFTETLNGMNTIRAFRAQDRFKIENGSRIDDGLRAYYLSIAANRWLAIRLEMIAAVIITLSALFTVIWRNDIGAEFGGLSISYSLTITQMLNWMVRMTSERETNIISVERVNEYSKISPEAPSEIEDTKPSDDWPASGSLSFLQCSLRYRPDLPLVLRDVTFEISSTSKVGIIGRTGSGKSTLLLAILRILELESGRICIDGVDISKIGLNDLRRRITIIPQSAFLFAGTVRSNLDPFSEHSDIELFEALERSNIITHIESLDGKLEAEVIEGGKNFSVGQRQLLCLARALLRRSKLMLLDEATSSVDVDTDTIIQQTIRREFANCTVITVAHRIDTVLDSDIIFVMNNGVIAEAGTPNDLKADPDSMFCEIIAEMQKKKDS